MKYTGDKKPIEYKGITYIFFNQERERNFIDFIENGLKLIKKENKIYTFNNGCRLVDISINDGQPARYILHDEIGSKTYEAERYLKKYIALIK